jgi:archaellum component FlaC
MKGDLETVHKNRNDVRVKPTLVAVPTAADANTNDASGASVDKIRDILFGSQIKSYETRLNRLEETLARESETMAARLKSEREERIESLKEFSRELKSSGEALTKKIVDLDKRTAEQHSGLRQELMTESRKLLGEIRHRHDDLTALLDRRVRELRHEKTDRATLSALFTEVALQIGGDEQAAPPAKTAKAVREA